MKHKLTIGLMAMLLMAVLSGTAVAQSTDCTGYATLPYSTGFEGIGTDSLPACWTQFQTSGGYGGVTFPCAYNYSGNARNGDVYFEFETHSGQNEVVALPQMQNVSSLMLNFWASAQSAYLPALFEVGVMEDSVFVPVDTITFTTSFSWGSGYHEYTVYFANYTGTGDRIAMRATGSGSSQYTLMMDDITVSEFTGCYPMSDLVLTSRDSVSITIGWSDPMNNAGDYTVSYWADGSTDTTVVTGVTTTSFTADYLNPTTLYHFLVQAECSGGSSLPLAGEFSTDCSGGSCGWVFNMTDTFGDGWNGNAIEVYQTGSLVASVTIASGYSSTETVTVCSSAPVELRFVQGSYASEMGGTVVDGGGQTVFTIAGMGSHSSGDVLATVSQPCPACLMPSNLAVSGVTSDEATVTWHANGTESMWWLMIDSTEIGIVYDTTYTFYNLDAMTGYTVYLAALCDSGDTSSVQTISFSTACADAECTWIFNLVDTYGDSWNGNAIAVYQVGNEIARVTVPSGAAYVDSVSVCSTVPVELRYVQGNYASEMSGTVVDGGGQTVFTIADMGSYSDGAVLATSTTPCPDCLMPLGVTVSDVTTSSATVSWRSQDGQSEWLVQLDTNDAFTVTDTFYTFTSLDMFTSYTVGVATVCSDASSSVANVAFTTLFEGDSCEMTVEMADSYGDGWNGGAVAFYQNNTLMGTATLTSGGSGTSTVQVCSGYDVELRLVAGSYPSEMSFTVYDGGGSVVYTASANSLTTSMNGTTLATATNVCPSCVSPSGLMVTYADSNQLTFVWTVNPEVDNYLVSFHGGPWVVDNSGVHAEYGLLPDSVYTFSIKAVCETGVDTSNVRTISGRTACGPMTLPYVEDFEGYAQGDAVSCWTVVRPGTSGTPSVQPGGHSGSYALSMSSNDTSLIASNAIPLPGDSIYVSFWAEAYYSTLEAGVMTNPLISATFIPMLTITSGNYERYEFNTSTLSPDSTYYLAFRQTGTYSYYSVSIDDINVRLDEGCMYPANVIATPDTVNPTAVITWTNAGSTNDFVLQYHAMGAPWSTPANPLGLSYTLSSLTSATEYWVRVGLVCGADTLWTETSFITACGLHSVPYFENFYSTTGTLPPCWDVSDPSKIRYDNWPYSSGNGALQGGNYSAGEYAVLPLLDAPFAKLEISFDAKLGNVSEGDGMMMGVYDDATGTVTWADTLTNPAQCRENYVRFTYNYIDYTGTGNRIAIGHSHNNPSDWGFYIDSLIVVALPDCYPPVNVTVHNSMYPYTADDVYFTWDPQGIPPAQYQVYIDTITSTVSIDSVPDSLFVTVDTNFYHPAVNTLAEGARYRFFVRSVCSTYDRSNWVELQNGFTTDEVWMNQSTGAMEFDTLTGCDFIIFDNGGPVAGYLHNSNSGIILQAGEANRQLELQGAFFNTGDDQATFTVYDGIGTAGTELYSRTTSNAHDQFDYIDSVLATSTTGALTITFTSGYAAALGYELYIHCVGAVSCPRPTNLTVEMTGPNTAVAHWQGTASLYHIFHRVEGDSVWNMLSSPVDSVVFPYLPADVNYEFRVVALCSATDSSASSITRHFFTHWVEPPVCQPVTDLAVSNITQTSASVSWTSDGNRWDVAIVGGPVVSTTTNPYPLTGLTPDTEYRIAVRNVCDADNDFYSVWSDTITFRTDTVPTQGISAVDAMGNHLALFPNPASTSVTVSLTGIEGTATVTLVDLNGRRCGEWTVTDGKLEIDLSSYAAGAYFVRLVSENATAVRKLIVR